MSEQCDGSNLTEVMFVLLKVPKLVYRGFYSILNKFRLLYKKIIYCFFES